MPAILLLIALLGVGHIEATETCPYKVDLLLIADGSDSICEGNASCPAWNDLRQFMHKIADRLTIGRQDSRVALVKYGQNATEEWNLVEYTDKTSLLSAIDNVQRPEGEYEDLVSSKVVITDVFTLGKGDRLKVTNVAMVFTDGMPNYDATVTGAISHTFQVTGVSFFVVGVKPRCDDTTAEYISSSPKPPNNQTYFFVNGYAGLDSAVEPVLEQLCFLLDACSRDTIPLLGISTCATRIV